jgi:D-glycero-alpha-D-manno-heptose-7-phosphate kinase
VASSSSSSRRPDKSAVRERLNSLIQVPFKFDFSGSQIIFCDREEDYAREEKARAAQPIGAFRELALSVGDSRQ